MLDAILAMLVLIPLIGAGTYVIVMGVSHLFELAIRRELERMKKERDDAEG